MLIIALFLDEEDYKEAEEKVRNEIPKGTLTLIEENGLSLPTPRKAVEFMRKKNFQVAGCANPISQMTFSASHRSPKIICTGVNYEDYRKLIGMIYILVLLIFLKSPSAVISHEETIYLSQGNGIFYHEWEFSWVISKRCRIVPKGKVQEVIFGYTIPNDLTAGSLKATNREFQPWGKNMDTYYPCALGL